MTAFSLISITSFVFQIIPNDLLSLKLRLNSNPSDDLTNLNNRRNLINSYINNKIIKFNLENKIEVHINNDLAEPFEAQGNTLLPGRAAILYNDKAFNTPGRSRMRDFFLSRELVKLQRNDNLKTYGIAIIAGIITTLALSVLLPSACMAGIAVAAALISILSRRSMYKMDEIANEGNNGGVNALKFIQTSRQVARERSVIDKCLITPQGDYIWDEFFTPSLNSRIQNLTKVQNEAS